MARSSLLPRIAGALRRAGVPAWVVVLLGLAIVFVLQQDVRRDNEARLQGEFETHAQETVDAIAARLDAYEQILRGTAGLFATGEVSRAGFATYVESLHLETNYPGILAVGFEPAAAGETIDYLARLPNRLFPVAAPTLHADAASREAMERARDTGKPAVSGRVSLAGGQADAAFVLYAPAYRSGIGPTTVEARREALQGWSYAPVRMHDFMREVLAPYAGGRERELCVEIFDGDAPSAEGLLYDSGDVLDAIADPGRDRWRQARFKLVHTVERGGNRWTLRFHSQPAFEHRALTSPQSWFVFVAAASTLLMAVIVHLLGSGRKRALRYAERMNRELSESEARFRLMADTAPVMIWMTDTEHRAAWTNERWQAFTGRDTPPQGRKAWQALIHRDDVRPAARGFRHAARARAPFRSEFRLRRADGTWRWVINTGVPRFERDGTFSGYIGSCLDITERKQAEEGLAGLTRRLEAYTTEIEDLYQNAPCGYHSLDAQGNILSINDTEIGWLGYAREELIGRPFAAILHPEDRPGFARRFPPTPREGEHRDIPCTLVRKNGSLLPVALGATHVRDAEGRLVRTRSVVHDMTEHRRLERERAEHAAHVERLLRRLVAVQEEERRLLAAMLHDRTSPNLATLKLILGSVAQAVAERDTARIEAALEDAGALLDDTTVGVREICSELHPTVLEFAGLLPALDSYAGQLARRTGIDVRVHGTAPGPLSSEVDCALFRIAQEALANSARHARANMIELFLETGPAGVRLTISDDGNGFDAVTGLSGGLGLITMRERAEFVGGRFRIESAPGAGVTIVVDIPLPRAAFSRAASCAGGESGSPQTAGG